MTDSNSPSTEPTAETAPSRQIKIFDTTLRDGEQAGLDAYREVEREIEAAGQSEGKLGVQVRAKIAEIERASGRAPRSVSR